MKFTPFTFDEATEICEDFEDLIDTEFTLDLKTYLIDNVVVSPFNEQDKQKFIHSHLAAKDGSAPQNNYKGEDYDVILFIYDADNEGDKEHINIRAFAAQQGIAYNFPIHS